MTLGIRKAVEGCSSTCLALVKNVKSLTVSLSPLPRIKCGAGSDFPSEGEGNPLWLLHIEKNIRPGPP